MAKPYQEGKGWSVRLRIKGQDIYLSGYASEAAARKAAEAERVAIEKIGAPSKLGPRRTSVAAAFCDYARERLPFLKGAQQDANRINRYLRLCGLPTIKLESVRENANGGVKFWAVTLASEPVRKMPNSLKAYRETQKQQGARTDKVRQQLAIKMVADVTPYDIQQLIDAMCNDSYEPATIALERSELRRLFNYARKTWLWIHPGLNPAACVTLPPVNNARDRVVSNAEWEKICTALQGYDNPYVIPAFALLLETAMRSSEPLTQATWGDVDWHRCIIRLRDAKAGPRDVPLTPAAIDILNTLQARAPSTAPDTKILPTTYEALKKAWSAACKIAGIDNAKPHDLRHTAATRFALEYNGNMPVLKIITGHKTDSQLMRYINIKTDDVVRMMHGRTLNDVHAPAGYRSARQTEKTPAISSTRVADMLPENVVRFDSGRRRA